MGNGFGLAMMSQSGNFNAIASKELIRDYFIIMLKTHKGEFFGDPAFGTDLIRLLFNPNDSILHDIIIDELLLSIYTYMKEITVTRNDIKIISNKDSIDIYINYVYNLDGTNDLFATNILSGV